VADEKETTDLVPRKTAGPPVAPRQSGALAGLDARISDPNTPVDQLGALIAYRAEVTKQDIFIENQGFLRRRANRESLGKMGFSAGGVVLGSVLFFTGHPVEGCLLLGMGFHWVAPELTRRIYDWLLGKDDDANK
jgi:hypothetical protein